jgi:hypothetical protein
MYICDSELNTQPTQKVHSSKSVQLCNLKCVAPKSKERINVPPSRRKRLRGKSNCRERGPKQQFHHILALCVYQLTEVGRDGCGVCVSVNVFTARIVKLIKAPRIDFKESIPPASVALAGRYDNPIPTRFLAPIECSKF